MLFVKRLLCLQHVLVAVLVCFGGLTPVGAVRADARPERLASLTISIWLEYDRPGALYIYRGELPEGTPLPAQITFRLPRQPSSTAGIDAEGRFRYARPVLSEDGDAYVVSYSTRWPRFQLEYYDDALRKQGASRELDYGYRAEHVVEHLVLEVKAPHAASDFRLEPAADAQSQADDGLTEYRRTVGPVAPGQEVRWKVTYTKSDPRLASEALGLPTAATSAYEAGPSPVSSLRGREWASWATWLVVALVGLIAVGGLGLAMRSSTGRLPRIRAQAGEPPGGRPKRRQRGKKARQHTEAPGARLAAYCHECGASLSRGDVFCRRCGARRRGG